MSEQEHTSEPWEAVASRVYFPDVQGGFDLRGCPAPEATARRIAACVNALQGVPTDWLERPAFKEVIDELLAAIAACRGAQ